MDPAIRRLGLRFRLSRDLAVFILLIGAFIAAVLWIGPDRGAPARLELLALDANGDYTADLALDSASAAPSRTPGRSLRFPLVLGVRNVGATPERPTALYLSVPGHLRLLDGAGQRLPSRRAAGSPLVRYRVELDPVEIEPAATAVPLGGADTLWLEPALPEYYCSLLSEGVPEFEAAPALDPEHASRVQVFYAFEPSSSARQAGLLALTVDPRLLRAEPAPAPPIFRTTYYETAAPVPSLGRLTMVGDRTESCGEPDLPADIHSVLWETEAGGRVFVVYTGGEPRKHLFDLDRDGVIEREMWDRDGDGRLDASRDARFRTPSLLLPIPTDAEWLAGIEPARPDSAWLRNFYNVAAGPFRFLRTHDDTAGAPPGTTAGQVATPSPSAPTPGAVTPETAPAPGAAAQGAGETGRAAAADNRAADTTRGDSARIFGQPVTRPADTAAPPRRIFGMPIIRPPGDTTSRDTVRRDTIRRDTLRRN